MILKLTIDPSRQTGDANDIDPQILYCSVGSARVFNYDDEGSYGGYQLSECPIEHPEFNGFPDISEVFQNNANGWTLRLYWKYCDEWTSLIVQVDFAPDFPFPLY